MNVYWLLAGLSKVYLSLLIKLHSVVPLLLVYSQDAPLDSVTLSITDPAYMCLALIYHR